jgi:DNA repair photolyase
MILSASRRTDIPSFYSSWFITRLRVGSVWVRNPLNSCQISEIPLSAENIDCIVFWTKDPAPLLGYLNEIDGMGYKYYFQFTVTPYDKDIEPNVRDKKEIMLTFKELAERLGKERMVLRYDPILFTTTDRYNLDYHVRAFTQMCEQLHEHTERVILSFFDRYRKIAGNIKASGMRELDINEMFAIGAAFSEIAGKYGLGLETCAERVDLRQFGIAPARCIDGDLIERIIGYRISNKDVRDGNREHCGCMKCIDIGQYDTCIHGCLYCYANIAKDRAIENHRQHDPASPLLLGTLDETEIVKPRNEKDTKSFKVSDEQLKLRLD